MLNIKNWTVGKRIYVLSFILLFTMASVGIVGYQNASNLMKMLDDLSETQLPAVRNMTLVDMMHDGLRAVAFHAIIVSNTNSTGEFQSVRDEFAEFSTNIKTYLENIESLEIRAETKQAIENAKPKLNEYIQATDEIINLALTGNPQSAIEKMDTFQKAFEVLEAELETLGTLIEEDANKSKAEGEALARRTSTVSTVVVLIGLGVGLFLSIWMARSLLNQLNRVAQQLKAEADGVKGAASSIDLASRNLSQSATQQASALQETASSIEEINAMVVKSTENANRSRDVASTSHDVANKGKESVLQMIAAIQEIDQSNENIMQKVEQGNRKIAEIVKVITEIGNKTKVINDIVFQTKLLSFNASVEAARAGEHGKGFAVVAEEVGNLAQMSGNAAKEISDMLGESIRKVEQIVNETKSTVERLISEGKAKVKSGTVVAQQCGEILEEVVRNVSEVNTMIGEISTASNEQAQGISEITKAMHQMDQVTHANATTSQEAAGSSEKLAHQSESLLCVVGMLEQVLYGTKSELRSNPPNERYGTDNASSTISGLDRGGLKMGQSKGSKRPASGSNDQSLRKVS